MDYEITRYKNGNIEAVEMTDGWKFETIKADAENWVEQGLADRVEVKTMSGELVYQHPRVLKPGTNA